MSVKVSPLKDPLPSLIELGKDLLSTSTSRQVFALSSPLICVALYIFFAWLGWWPLAVVAVMMLTFITYGSTSHDLVHRNLKLPNWLNEIALSIIEMIPLRSGHAYRLSHLNHHRYFPDFKDVEGSPAYMPLWRAVLEGPIYIFRLWIWSWKYASQRDRIWITFETLWLFIFIGFSLYYWKQVPALLIYAGLNIGGSWVFPILLVVIPHDAHGKSPLFHTRAFRGKIIPALFLEHTYHLEHHLYPQVPSHHWLELSKRLEPHLIEAGVPLIRIP